MIVELLYTRACHAYRRAVEELEAAFDEVGLPVNFAMIRIDKQTEAKKFKFSGSPAIHIDDKDIDPRAGEIKTFSVVSCRPYLWDGKGYDWPPMAMIVEALKKKL